VSPISRALVFHGPERPLEIQEIPIPNLQGDEVLVEVVACTLCGSDLHTIQGKRVEPVPTILGHEILGRIVEFGPTARHQDAAGEPLKPGDRVTWGVVASCGQCHPCRHSLPQKCERKVKYGHEVMTGRNALRGGLADHCLLAPGSAIFRIPDRLSDATVSPANCATATVAAAFEAAGDLAGGSVLIGGCGMLGVTAAAWAKSLGCAQVIACDLDHDRRVLAGAFGASRVGSPENLAACIMEATEGRGVDALIELTGSADAFEAAYPLVRLGGTIVLVGAVYPTRAVSLVMEDVVRRCLTIRGVHNYAPWHLRAALDFLHSRPDLPFDSLVSRWIPLDQVSSLIGAPLPPGILRLGVRPLVELSSVGENGG